MGDVSESWSLPWHALQRSLAQGLGAEMSGAASFRKANVELLDAAREKLDRAEVLKSTIMAKIERLEDHILSRR
jgi:hypothetical protein